MLDPLVGSVESLLYVGTYISLVVVAVWLGIAYYTGNKFQEQTEERNAANQPAPTKQTAGDQGGIEIELDSVSDGKDHA
jgi:membrane protein implicated in regulation of membrane protease activity